MFTIFQRRIVSVLMFLWLSQATYDGYSEQKRPITPRDCVTVKRLSDEIFGSAITINPQGTMAAYLVNAPNLATNQNDIELYVKQLSQEPDVPGRLLLTGARIKQLTWLGDGKHLVMLLLRKERTAVVTVEAATGRLEELARAPDDKDINEYTVSRNGSIVVFAVAQPANVEDTLTPEQVASGYRIPFERSEEAHYKQAKLYLVTRDEHGIWSRPRRLNIPSPFTQHPLQTLPYQITLHLSLSPDGRSLLFMYMSLEDLPPSWKASPIAKSFTSTHGIPLQLTALYNIGNGDTEVTLKSAFLYQTPIWSPDGKRYLAVSTAPLGSIWEQDDAGSNDLPPGHVLSVNPVTGETEQILGPRKIPPRPLAWNTEDEIVLRTAAYEISQYSRSSAGWKRTASFRVPLPTPRTLNFSQMAGDGVYVIGDHQDAQTPPELFLYKNGEKTIRIFSKLNPQFDHLMIAPTLAVSWNTSTGYEITGSLVVPPDFSPTRQYPLVIQTKPDNGGFVCDSGDNHYPSFAPQPLANAGILYLSRTWPKDFSYADDEAHYPEGYPSGVAEAAFHMDIWESAVDSLATRGIVDRNKVGIIGFSRSGWYTEFILAHSKIHFQAATAADNIQYSLGEYWLVHTLQMERQSDTIYGGPPFGDSLNNWLKYSVSFNLDKFHTPLLMEQFGDGVPYDHEEQVPLTLAASFEVFAGLHRLRKPVELYYYPNDVHQPVHPRTRLASLERNVDWYRFWLQGYERSGPEDPDQYNRWRNLRALKGLDSAPHK
jgi:dipeptidyl aminopeptidase/acylaminoacyl peptidase